MNSKTSWNERGLSPELYQAARQAADRAGMSVNDWLSSTFGDSAAPAPTGQNAGSLGSRLGELSQRLSRSAQSEPAFASDRSTRLVDTAARLNDRLEQLTHRLDSHPATADPSPPIAPALPQRSFAEAIAEIATRRRTLDNMPMPSPVARQAMPEASTDISSALAGLRADLGDLSRTVRDTLPHQAIEGLQSEIHQLSERVDRASRSTDSDVLQSIERRLGEFHDRMSGLNPAPGLAALDSRVSELARKVDGLGGSPDPETLRYLEAAINEVRELSAGVASAEGVASLAGDIQSLATRIDQMSVRSPTSDVDLLAQRFDKIMAEHPGTAEIEALSRRFEKLTQTLDTRANAAPTLPPNLEALISALSDKLDRTDNVARDESAFQNLEQQIVRIADKVDATDSKLIDFNTLERGIQELTKKVSQPAPEPKAAPEVVAIKRDIESLHVNQAQSEQRTHDTLEAVHGTLERLVERLALIEAAPAVEPAPRIEPAPVAELQAFSTLSPQIAPEPEPAAEQDFAPAPRATPFGHLQRPERAPIDPDLPADTPLEPGSAGRTRVPSPAERIAASEAALAPLSPEPTTEITGKANFIAAARRAAQAAANEGNPVEGPRTEERKEEETPTSLIGRFLANRRRALILGVSALLVLYGAIQLSSVFDGRGNEPAAQKASQAQTGEPQKVAQIPAPTATPDQPPAAAAEPATTTPAAAPAKPTAAAKPVTTAAVPPAPTTPATQSTQASEALLAPTPAANQIVPTPAPVAPEVTGSVTTQNDIAALATQLATPATLEIPVGIGGPALRAAAAAGNASAQYEIGIRYSEGHGVPANLELAAQWFDRAAKQGLAPALYRLGSFYEKGQGVKKNLDKARELYLLSTDKGNAKATHNLAVLYAEGIDGKPDYKTASQWFRKAADRGVADSQYNLGILYARGIGVDQNLAESYKWFALAANQGDKDAAKKRDDVAGRLDQQSLVAAKLAVQTWAADLPPDEAMNVKAPPGGWDRTATSTKPAKPAKPTSLRSKAQSPS